MNVEGGTIGRRAFIGKTASFLLGTWLGLDTLSTAMAFGFRKTPPLAKSVISLIIDDMGYSLSRTEQFLNLEIPLTFSILPRLPRSEKVALEIHAQGHEIMLHQPMQPYNADLDPGPGALYVGDGTKKITRIVEENISSLPLFQGLTTTWVRVSRNANGKWGPSSGSLRKGGSISLTASPQAIPRPTPRPRAFTCPRPKETSFSITCPMNRPSSFSSTNSRNTP